jgi:elongation factor 1 alpha-like protein
MRTSTIAVREELPSNAGHITDKEIQESLWHYYYDVEKSVAYLVSKHVTKPKAKKKEKVKAEHKMQGGLFSFLLGGAVELGCGVRESAGGGLPFE